MKIIIPNRKKIGCGIGVGMLIVGFICLIGGIVYGAMPFINWSKSLAIFGWLIPITIGIIIIVIGIILLFVLCYISKRNKNSDEGGIESYKAPGVLHQQGRVELDSDWGGEVELDSDGEDNN